MSAPGLVKKTQVVTSNAPKALPELMSQGIKAGGFVYCSGSVAMDPATGKIVDGDVQAHTHQCIKNLTAVLEAAGTTIDNVVKVNVYLSNPDDYAKMNEAYMKHWGDIKPCRTCVTVKALPLNTDVEIECTAVL